jgi:hypothetical protein
VWGGHQRLTLLQEDWDLTGLDAERAPARRAKTLQKAGFVPYAHILNGTLRE